MAVKTPPAPVAPSRAVSRAHRGIPDMVSVRSSLIAESQMEIDSLRDELRTLGRLSPHASRVHAYVQGIAESVEVVNLSAAVAAYLARAARRHP